MVKEQILGLDFYPVEEITYVKFPTPGLADIWSVAYS
jgi:hypothetical protein